VTLNVNELTRKLIDIPSLSGDEKLVGRFLQSQLESRGYVVEIQQVVDEAVSKDANERFNVIATTGLRPRVVLSTHMDTVPPYISSSENEEKIFGRGACDAKGIIAAQIMAAERLRAEGTQEIGLLFTVDEEQASLGAAVANKYHHEQPPEYLINGEPTDNKLASATKGSLRLEIRARGRAAHSAYPEQGESAIEKLLDVLESIRKCEWPGDEMLGPTTSNIGVIRGGTRANVVPEEAAAVLQIRLVSEAGAVKKMLENAVAGRAAVEYLSEHQPVRLHTVSGIEQCIVRFTTDIPYLSRWGKPLLLGPGSILNAHTDHEFISKQELAQAVDLYARLVHDLLARETQERDAVEGASR
jgi:acetylornithine deacetylase